MTGPRPLYTAAEAVERALAVIGRGIYKLGTGDLGSLGDDPRDCFGFAVCELYGIRRHRPGFNRGSWSTVSDDLNSNSAIEDANHQGELFERIFAPAPGVLLAYPTIRLPGHPELLDIVQCRGPNGRRPGIVATDGSLWDHHDFVWPRTEHRTVMLKVIL